MRCGIKSCAVAPPSKRNSQLLPNLSATHCATTAQQGALKALARAVIERNDTRNPSATPDEKVTQLLPPDNPEKLRSFGAVAEGSACPCGSKQYRSKAFLWRDMKGGLRQGYECLKCKTRYCFV